MLHCQKCLTYVKELFKYLPGHVMYSPMCFSKISVNFQLYIFFLILCTIHNKRQNIHNIFNCLSTKNMNYTTTNVVQLMYKFKIFQGQEHGFGTASIEGFMIANN
jgi:hypothetical protein